MTCRPLLVISAVNFTEGGPLTVLRDCIYAAEKVLPENWDIVVFVHQEGLVPSKRCRFIALPRAKRSWINRLWVEWWAFRQYAKQLKPVLWLSLHDISPNVGRIRQAVYCHNPSPFFKIRLRDAWLDPKIFLFRVAYGWLYRIGLGKNDAVIVQQSWLRESFRTWSAKPRIIVATPVRNIEAASSPRLRTSGRAIFLYPTLPRVFKNIELLCDAAVILEKNTQWQSEIVVTIDGSENAYARWLKKRYSQLKTVRFIGRQVHSQMSTWYATADCLLFPSRLETWGLPISEAKASGLPILVADLPYAHETVGTYHSVDFIDPDDSQALAHKLLAFQENNLWFASVVQDAPSAPFAADWLELIRLLINTPHQPI